MNTESHRFAVGSFACTAVSDGTFPYPPPGFAANVPPARVAEELVAHGRPAEVIVTPYTCLVVETGRHRILVDTGMGPLPPGLPDTTGKLPEHLRAADIDPAGIDTVVLTHGHADHIGGNLDATGAPAFPNARFAMWRSEWEYWTAEPSLAELQLDDHVKELLRQAARTNLPPLRNRPAQAVATRRRLFDQAADERALVLRYHFPFPGLGRVERAGEGWRWEPAATA